MEKLKSILVSLSALLLVLPLGGCKGRARLPYDYLSASFRVGLRWTVGTVTVLAEGTAAPASAEGALWDIDLTLTSPESLCGIRIIRREGALSLTYGDLMLREESFSALLDAVEPLLWSSPVEGLCRDTLSGLDVLYGRRYSGDGADFIEVYFDPRTGYPLLLRHGQTELTVIEFQPMASDT